MYCRMVTQRGLGYGKHFRRPKTSIQQHAVRHLMVLRTCRCVIFKFTLIIVDRREATKMKCNSSCDHQFDARWNTKATRRRREREKKEYSYANRVHLKIVK